MYIYIYMHPIATTIRRGSYWIVTGLLLEFAQKLLPAACVPFNFYS